MNGGKGAVRLSSITLFATLTSMLDATLIPADVHAQAADAAKSATRQVVEIRVVGAAGDDQAIADRIASWFDGSQFDLRVRAVPKLEPQHVLSPDRRAIVHVWVTLKNERLARLYFTLVPRSTDKPNYLLRDLALENGLDEIGAERIAQALHLSTLALLEGQVESPRAQIEDSLQQEHATESFTPASTPQNPVKQAHAETQTQTTARKPSSLSASLGLGYGARFRGDEGVGHGPRADFRLAFAESFGARTRVQLMLPAESELSPITLKLYGVSWMAALSLRQSLTSRLALEGFFGPALDFVHYQPVAASDAAISVADEETEVRPNLAIGTALWISAAPRWGFIAELALALSRTHYDLVFAGERQVIGRAPQLMPTVAVEVEF